MLSKSLLETWTSGQDSAAVWAAAHRDMSSSKICWAISAVGCSYPMWISCPSNFQDRVQP